MKDGLYIVDHGTIYGAFVIRNEKVTVCAPVLRKNIGFYKQIARYVPTEVDAQPVLPGGETEQPDDYPPPWRPDCD